MRVRNALLCGAWFAVLVLIVRFGTGWVRGSFGDLVVVPWLASALGVLWPTPILKRVVAALGVAFCLEFLQLVSHVRPEDPLWIHLIFGSTFDLWDLLHYTVGAAVGVSVEEGLRRRVESRKGEAMVNR